MRGSSSTTRIVVFLDEVVIGCSREGFTGCVFGCGVNNDCSLVRSSHVRYHRKKSQERPSHNLTHHALPSSIPIIQQICEFQMEPGVHRPIGLAVTPRRYEYLPD